MTLLDFMNGHPSLLIRNLYDGEVVRALTVMDDKVIINADGALLILPIDTALTYEPWTFDRGSILFKAPDDLPHPSGGGLSQYAGKILKLCTELDPIDYPDGTKGQATIPGGTFSE